MFTAHDGRLIKKIQWIVGLNVGINRPKEEGLSVLEDLRKCVQQAANAFGTGIVRFSAGNQDLRERLRNDAGLKDELQREIMRYMYKLIFLFVMEDRDLLLRKSGEQNYDSDVELGRTR